MPLPLQSGTSFSGTVAWSSYVEMEASCSPGASISMNPEQSSCSFNLDILSLLCLATKIICLFIMLELLDVQTRLRKGRGNRDQIANICCVLEKAGKFQKTSTSASLTMQKPLTVWITINCGKFKRWEYKILLPAS